MAKKKKHRPKKSKHNNKVVKKTTLIINESSSSGEITKKNSEDANKNEAYVLKDVKFSLIILGVIIFCFIAIYILMMNKSVSNYLYGIIKINL